MWQIWFLEEACSRQEAAATTKARSRLCRVMTLQCESAFRPARAISQMNCDSSDCVKSGVHIIPAIAIIIWQYISVIRLAPVSLDLDWMQARSLRHHHHRQVQLNSMSLRLVILRKFSGSAGTWCDDVQEGMNSCGVLWVLFRCWRK